MSMAIQSGFFSRRAALCLCWGMALVGPAVALAQTNYYKTSGSEYLIVGSLPGDQVFPDVALNSTGGFIVWQDNITDGSGWGISEEHLDSTLSGSGSSFRVNVQGANDQENARVAMLKNGGAAFVWQGGLKGFQQVYTRFLSPANTWLTTNDVLVSSPETTNVTYSYFTNTTYTSTITTNVIHGKVTYTTNTTATVTTTITTNMTPSGSFRVNPAVATLANSNVVVVWASFNEAGPGTMQDVYGQIFSPSGQKIGGEFLVNQFTNFNQRKPAVAALANGGFVVAWISEQERVAVSSIDNSFYGSGGAGYVSTNENAIGTGQNTNYYVGYNSVPTPSVDVYARLYDSKSVAVGNEFLVNSNFNICASPAVAAASDGTFMVAWCARDLVNPSNGWDIYARPFSSTGVGGVLFRVNTTVVGDQYNPKINVIGLDYLIVWTSMGQDGSLEGVYGQFVHEDGTPLNGEFLVNTTTLSRQMQPAVASDGANRFLAVWTGYNAAVYNFDLYAQQYINVNADLSAMDAPFVYAPFTLSNNVYQPQLCVSWPPVLGISISNYEVYVDGTNTTSTTSNCWTMTAANGLTTNSTHLFQLTYVTTTGASPPALSPATSGTTWSGANYYGLPLEWVEQYYGTTAANWPSNVNAPLVAGGPTLYQVFLSGGDPLEPGTWLKSMLAQTTEGLFLSWNTQPGFTYQVQVSTNFTSWSNVGAPRFAAGTSDSIYVGGSSVGYYRIVLLRQ
jgi:hypothetical protein